MDTLYVNKYSNNFQGNKNSSSKNNSGNIVVAATTAAYIGAAGGAIYTMHDTNISSEKFMDYAYLCLQNPDVIDKSSKSVEDQPLFGKTAYWEDAIENYNKQLDEHKIKVQQEQKEALIKKQKLEKEHLKIDAEVTKEVQSEDFKKTIAKEIAIFNQEMKYNTDYYKYSGEKLYLNHKTTAKIEEIKKILNHSLQRKKLYKFAGYKEIKIIKYYHATQSSRPAIKRIPRRKPVFSDYRVYITSNVQKDERGPFICVEYFGKP